MGAEPASRVLHSRELMADDMVIVVPAEHRWAARKSVSLKDITQESLILREPGSGSREAFERALAHAGLDFSALRVAGEMGSTQEVKQGVRAGVGVALISKRAVEDECRARLLWCVKVTDLQVLRSFYVVTHRQRTRSPLAQAFLGFVESQIVGTPS